MLKKLLKLFFPEICLACSQVLLENENTICLNCRHRMPLTNDLLVKENESFKKFYGRILVEHASVMSYYHKKGITQQLIHNLKYKNHQEIGKLLGEWYVQDLRELAIIKTIDYVIPVPLHPKKLKKRGYNQIHTFSLAIANGLNKPLETNILFRNIHTDSQSKKSLIDRNTLPENTFGTNFSNVHHNKHFLIIDDVLTTGATLEACGKEILKIPGAKISIIAIAISDS
jgi:ComF family protein